jgi:hypothetical protein
MLCIAVCHKAQLPKCIIHLGAFYKTERNIFRFVNPSTRSDILANEKQIKLNKTSKNNFLKARKGVAM